MKLKYLYILIAVLLVCGACVSPKELEPVRTETVEFDMDAAVEMVLSMERCVNDLAVREQVTRQELDDITAQMEAIFHDDGPMIVQIFFDVAQLEDTAMEEIDLYPHNFYPTAYHRGIEITDATVMTKEYDDPFFSRTFLSIREEYTGEDPLLIGFYREYVFEQKEDGWSFSHFEGTINYQGEEYHRSLLPMNQ